MNVAANGKNLAALTQQLLRQWEQTRAQWHDVKSVEFEQQYLVELTAQAHKAGIAFEELDKLLAKVQKDCE